MNRVNIEIVERVIEYIEANIDEKLDLDQISTAVGYSKFHLHRLFVNATGMTIHNYVLRRKLTESAKLLVLSDMPIIEIAFKCGYESQQAYSVAFKSMYKSSPSRFRLKGNFYPLQLPWKFDIQIDMNMILDTNLRPANIDDLDSWLDLMRLVIDGYPHLDEGEYYIAIRRAILENRAIVLYDDRILVGAVAFSVSPCTIEFLGIHPLYRQFDIHILLLNKVIDEYLFDSEICMTTFRDGDKADTGYRALLKEFGFVERELLMEYDYPTQRMVYGLYDKGEELR